MNIIELRGNWKAGWALDLHTIKSVPTENGYFDTTYTEIGYALNQLKYHQDYSQVDILVNKVLAFMETRVVTSCLDVIFPTPPSTERRIQPVETIAERIGKALNISVDKDYLVKVKSTNQLKNIDDKSARENILNDAFNVVDTRYHKKKVMIFDDLFRSGATLKEITGTLYEKGGVNDVYVVTLTKTRARK